MNDQSQNSRDISWPIELNSSTGIASTSSTGGTARFRGKAHVATAALVALLSPLAHAESPPLSHQEAMRIGRKIWQNECGGSVAGLTSWNAGENFASLGIGHFIWHPAGGRGRFEESFPPFVRYVTIRGAKLPALLLGQKSRVCPWNSRAEFVAAESTPEMKQLRIFLTGTIDLQADFLVERLRNALPKMLAAVPTGERSEIEERFNRLADLAGGYYALIDYVNFKGEGVLATERYRGRGWGLLQVLKGMSSGVPSLGEFAGSAERVLRERVANAPPERHEGRWLAGWLKRVETYR